MGVTRVVDLRPSERIVIDAAATDALFRRMGSAAAEDHVMETVESISDILAEVEGLLRHGEAPGIVSRGMQVAALSMEIGLSSLARVSRDLSATARRGDAVALRAVWERLVRIGDRSLAQVWELPGLSM